MKREGTHTRSVPLPIEEEEAREEEEGGMVAVARVWKMIGGHVHHITLNFHLKYQNEINCL